LDKSLTKDTSKSAFDALLGRFDKKPEYVRKKLDEVAIGHMSTYYNMLLPQEVLISHLSIICTKAVLSQKKPRYAVFFSYAR